MTQPTETNPTAKQITWQSVKEELNVSRTQAGAIDFDGYRKDKLRVIERHTKRPLLVYAVDFLNQQKVNACKGDVSIDLSDLQGFREILKNIKSKKVDILLHSPGGSPDAAESVVQVIRDNFKEVRFFIPLAAKSAATMIALSGDEILMPAAAELGPIDPQFSIPDGAGGRLLTPAQALIDQFERAKMDIQDDQRLALVWAPILQIYSPGLYQLCINAITRSKELVKEWLENFMFKKTANKSQLAQNVVDYLGDHNNFKSHGKRVPLSKLQELKIVAKDIRKEDATLWNLVEEAWYAIEHTFGNTGAYKLFENSKGVTLVKIVQTVIQPISAGR